MSARASRDLVNILGSTQESVYATLALWVASEGMKALRKQWKHWQQKP